MDIYLKYLVRIIVINILSLCSLSSYASDCGVLQVQINKSSGVSVKANKCKQLPDIALGTIFELSAKGRLWLKSRPSQSADSDFQMICQNRTSNMMQLEYSGNISPWLNLAKLGNCTGWVDNKLSCHGGRGEQNGFFCVLSFYKDRIEDVPKQIERTTSVIMREIKIKSATEIPPAQVEKMKVLQAIKADFKLCKKLTLVTQDVNTKWSVLGTEIQRVEVIPALNINDEFYECIETVIRAFPYPSYAEEELFSTTY